jgi:hypothetical protein
MTDNITLPRAVAEQVREAGIVVTGEAVWRLCELVAEAEREAICELADNLLRTSDAVTLIDAIRARGSK